MSAREEVRTLLRTWGALSSYEIAKAAGIPRDHVRTYIYRLMQVGCEIENLTASPAKAVYRLNHDPLAPKERVCIACGAHLRRGNADLLCSSCRQSL